MGSIAISRNGQIVYRRSVGYARIGGTTGGSAAVGGASMGDGAEANANTEYRIGSITKMFTATLVFQLLEEKRLYLEDKLSAYFPQLPNAGEITIANLLDHRSGLPDFTKNTDFDSWKDGPRKQEELLALITGRKPDFAPNAKADYNNSNYLVLSLIIEKVTRTPYFVLLDQRIFRRLGLTHTYYAQSPALARYEAASYHYSDGKWTPDKAVWLDNFRGAGAIVSTPTDLLIFINALFSGKLVTSASLRTMEKMVDGYGMGMFPFDVAGHPGFGHNGKTEGFAASLTYYPEDKIAIAYCTNGEIYSKNWILDGVKAIVLNQAFAMPDFLPVTLPEQVLDRDTGRYRSATDGIGAVIKRNGNQLVLETRGKAFPIVALTERRFWNREFGFFFDIDPGGLNIIDVESEYYLQKQ
jgi:CubicO group peptidase (beta-lactamase class C family)